MSDLSEKIARLSPKRLALLALELQAKLDGIEQERREAIAIVGVGCRFPGGVTDPEEFWTLLHDGVDAVTEVPPERWDVDAYYDADPEAPAKTYSRHGAFLEDIDRFDPHFFGIAPREAIRMDPQQRLVLEVSWEALERAGIAPGSLSESRTGVFVGISGHDYADLLGRAGSTYLDAHFLTGNPLNFAAGRLSYTLGLQGPSMAIDTACSSSLVAVHLACQSLRAKECNLALAAGVNLVLVPEANVVLAKARMLAVDGRCKTFDAAADGYVRGEGCGVVVLKRLSDAVANGDSIVAVIRGSATNQDGPSSGLTVPNGPAQQALIREALAVGGIKPTDVSYVEAHGTGTSLGDPIEVQALAAALGEGRRPDNPLLIGSVKTNVGHLEAAAGITGLIKVVLALQHRTIPPHLHLRKLNPNISLDTFSAAIPVVPTAWTPQGGRRIAGVSSFGASGTNAHIVLEEAPDQSRSESDRDRPLHVLTLSAKSADALDDLRARFARQLESDRGSLADLCFTANAGRSHFPHRLAVVGRDGVDIARRLSESNTSDGVRRGQVTGPDRLKVAFVFPGQGFDAGRLQGALSETSELYASQPTFRQTVDRCRQALQAAGADPSTAAAQQFVFEYGMAALWRAWGIEPAAVLGSGAGEYAAACVAGIYSLEDAATLVAARNGSPQDLAAAMSRVTPRRPNIAVISGDAIAAHGISRVLTMGALDATDGPRDGGTWLASTTAQGECWTTLLDSLASLYVSGAPVEWAAFDRDYSRRPVLVPTYPFRRQRFWPDVPAAGFATAEQGQPLLGSRLRTALSDKVYQCRLTPETPAFLGDHRVQGAVVFPATGYIAIAHAAARESWPGEPGIVEDLIIHEALVVPSGGRTIQTTIAAVDETTVSFRVLSADDRGDESWREHASGTIRRAGAEDPAPAGESFEKVQARCTIDVALDDYYERLRAGGLEFGASFRGITRLARAEREAFGEVRLPESIVDSRGFEIHPALLDACFQVLGAARHADDSGDTYLPLGIARVRIARPAGTRVFSHVRFLTSDQPSKETLTADLTLYDEQGTVLGVVEGLQLKRTAAVKDVSVHEVSDSLYEIEWQRAPALVSRDATPGAWLLFADDSGVAEALARRLEASGRSALLVRAGERYERDSHGHVRLDPGNAEHFARLREDVLATGTALGGVVHLWSLNQADAGVLSAQRFLDASALHLAQMLVGDPLEGCRLIVVTRGALSVDGTTSVDPVQASLWGLCRTVSAEFPDLPCIRVDLDPSMPVDADAILAEIDGDSPEDQIARRGSDRYAPRLVRSAAARASGRPAGDRPMRLSIDERGVLENLRLAGVDRQAPEAGQVEIRVQSTGLNFRDVLNALGMYPGDPGPIGNECVGTIVRVGDRVDRLKVGETVMALGAGTFGTYVTTPADLASPIPRNLSVDEAATIPITFLTAEFALNRLAGMKAGDRVLIHAAAGGVGLAALQLAQAAGAEIFATAGSPEKRALLQSLGVTHVMDSRSLSFADEIMAITRGEGIDIVLNSLAGEFIPKSLGTLRQGGRFLEIGKTGIWDAAAVAQTYPGVSYHAIYLGEVDPRKIQTMLRELAAKFEAGALKPLPLRVFPLERAVDAFRFMAQARHIGKLVISQASSGSLATRSRSALRDDRTYLITGGYGGLGLIVARWMIERGARHLVLVGRRGPSDASSDLIAALNAHADVRVVPADISSATDVARVLAGIAAAMPALGGVVHAAGVLDDAALMQQTWNRFEQVLMPKAAGAWLLHEQTKLLPLDFFVMFSSVASVLGNPGQANYAAANAFLDGLAHFRRAQGLPAVSINWGPWSDAGMALNVERTAVRWRQSGINPITAEFGVAALERAFDVDRPQVTVLRTRWATFMQQFAPGREPRLLADFAASRKSAPGRSDRSPSAVQAELVALVEQARVDDRPRIVSSYVRDQTFKVLGLDATFDLAPHQGLRDLGLDSLLAVELRNRLQRAVGRSLPATLAFDCPTVEALSAYLTDKVSDALADVGRVFRPAVVGPAAADTPAPSSVRSATPAAVSGAAEAVAIIGVGCRLPGGANSPDAFWNRLRDGYDATSEIPAERWSIDEYYDANPETPGKMYTRRGAFLDRIDGFDPQFFGMAPREAVSLDPQQRLLLEVSWEALEHAGQAPDKLLGSKTGVFVGINGSDYGFLQMAAPESPDLYFGTGNAMSAAAGRLSYVLGLQGPSLSVDTACSSSLVAVHLASQSLRNQECRLAIAGGVNIILNPDVTVNFCRARMLSPEGRCKTFDAAADGYVRGEGCGIIVLKRLSDALADGDRVLAVIRGSAVNQDGRSSGLTVPNGPAQEEVVREALKMAHLAPAAVGYVEAHGTGTSLGDPIEIQALGAALGEGRPPDRPLLVGSVKTNIGHLEGAAGIASLIKVVLALGHNEIPAHLNFSTPNPHIAWSELPIEIVSTRREWPSVDGRRIAGVSSFGFTGTNAHIVIEAAAGDAALAVSPDRPSHVLALSARSGEALRAIASGFAEALEHQPEHALADICFTANSGRVHHAHRLALHARSLSDVREGLTGFVNGKLSGGVAHAAGDRSRASGITFMFTGQGSQYAGMGRELYETQPTFRAALDRCAALLANELERPLLEVIYPASGQSDLLDQTAYTQAALFSIEFALAELWKSWGVVPTTVLGHSVGEYVAACVAGVFSLEDGLKLIAARGRLMQALPPGGGMVAVGASESVVRESIGDTAMVAVAAVNAPEQVVMSGELTALGMVVDRLTKRNIRTTPLTVSHAFHSPLLDPMLDAFERVASAVTYHPPRIAVISNVTGQVAQGDDLTTAAYWRRHAREGVLFARSVSTLVSRGDRLVVEIGPQPTLTTLARRTEETSAITWAASLRPGRSDWATLLEAVGALYVQGASIGWAAIDEGFVRRKVALPTYPFERQRYWVDLAPPSPRGLESAPAAVAAGGGSDTLYGVEWVEQALTPPELAESPQASAFVVLSDGSRTSDDIVQGLEARGARVIVSAADASDSLAFERSWQDTLERLEGAAPSVVYVPALDADRIGPELARTAVSESCRLLTLVQCLVRTAVPGTRLTVVTRGALGMSSHRSIALAQAPLVGMMRTLLAEHPDLAPMCVDAPEPGAAIDHLVDELLHGPAGEQVAFRNGRRVVARLARLANTSSSAVIRPDGTYLVTGGLGALGLVVAKWLVDRGARSLMLIGRSAPSDTAQSAIRDLELSGCSVRTARADVSREEDVRSVLAGIDRDLPPLRGIVHAAGVLDDGMVMQQTEVRFSRVMAPKVAGAWNLHVQTLERPLDCFVLFSSVAAVFGSAGQSNYAAANVFLDALAQERRRQGLPAVSINWGPWADGMAAAAADAATPRWKQSGVQAITADEGRRFLDRAISSAVPQVLAASVDWERFRAGVGAEWPLMAGLAGAHPTASIPRRTPPRFDLRQRVEEARPNRRRTALEAGLRDVIREVFALESSAKLDPRQGFRELGMDSLMAMELRNHLQRGLGQPLSATLAFDYPTLEALTAYLASEVLSLPSIAESDEGDEKPVVEANAGGLDLLARAEELSDEEIDRLLSDRFAAGAVRDE